MRIITNYKGTAFVHDSIQQIENTIASLQNHLAWAKDHPNDERYVIAWVDDNIDPDVIDEWTDKLKRGE